MKEAYIVAAARTPVGKAPNGKIRTVRPDDLAALAIKGALARVPQLPPDLIEDFVLGCAMPEGAQGMNIARIACTVSLHLFVTGRGIHAAMRLSRHPPYRC